MHLHIGVPAVYCVLGWRVDVELSSVKSRLTSILESLGEGALAPRWLPGVFFAFDLCIVLLSILTDI